MQFYGNNFYFIGLCICIDSITIIVCVKYFYRCCPKPQIWWNAYIYFSDQNKYSATSTAD